MHPKDTRNIPAPSPGDLIAGRYRIVRPLGKGGFGAVYHARQENMGRDVAIKTLLPQISHDPVAVERFRREAFHASSLKHPNTITLHDYGQDNNGLFYIVMELLEGEVLSRAIYRNGGLVLGRAMRIGAQVLRSLGEAHQRGLVHRDLKPENIFLLEVLGQKDFVKVLDFGLSKALNVDSSHPPEEALTQHGMVFGTPLYMAPEQAYGEPVLPASDVFAFGLLFYEMLVGKRPYEGLNQMDVMMKITQEPMPRLPGPLGQSPIQRYLDHLTEKEVKDRFKSAANALVPLERMLRGEGLEPLGNLDRVYVGQGSPSFGKGSNLHAKPPAIPSPQSPQPPPNTPSPKPQNTAPSPPPPQPQKPAPPAKPKPAGRFSRKPKASTLRAQRSSPRQNIQYRTHPETPPSARPEPRSSLAERSTKQPRTIERRSKVVPKLPPPPKLRSPLHDTDPSSPAVPAHVYEPEDSPSTPSVVVDEHERASAFAHEDATVIMSMDEITKNAAKTRVVRLGSDQPLIGRSAHLHQLSSWAERAAQGQGGFVILEGEAGVGKSKLLDAVAHTMVDRHDVRVVRSTYVADSLGPGTGLRQIVELLFDIQDLPDDQATQRIAQRFQELEIRSEKFVSMLMTVLRSSNAQMRKGARDLGHPHSTAFSVTTPAVYRMLEWVLVRESRRKPLLMLLDDLHLADSLSVGFAEYVATWSAMKRQEQDVAFDAQGIRIPLVIMCTARREDMLNNPELVRIFQQLGQNLGMGFAHIELPRLDARSALSLAEQSSNLDSPALQNIAQISQGNPLAVLELLRLAHASQNAHLPTPTFQPAPNAQHLLAETIHKRVALLPMCHPNATKMGELLRFVSVLGVWFSFDLLESYLVHMGREDLVRSLPVLLNHLCAEHLLTRINEHHRGVYRFEHPLVREVLRDRAHRDPTSVRLHEAAARAKEFQLHEGVIQPWLGGISRHWQEAGNPARMMEFSLREARGAERSWDFKLARSLYQKVEDTMAREQTQNTARLEVQYALAGLHIRLGEMGPAEDIIRYITELARGLQDPRWEARAQIALGRLLTLRSRYREALRAYRRALACFSQVPNPNPVDLAGMADALLGQGEVARARGDLGPAEMALKKALQQARQASAPVVEAHCLRSLGRIAHVGGRLQEAAQHFQGAAQQFDRSGLVIDSASSLSDLALTQLFSSGRLQALRTIEQSSTTLNVAGDRLAIAEVLLHKGIAMRRGMDMPAALRVAQQSLASFQELKHSYGIGKARLLLGELAFLQGDIEQAEQHAQQALAVHEEIGDAHGTVLCLLCLGCWALEQGRFDEAVAQLTHALDIVKKSGLLLYKSACHAHLGKIEEHQGRLGAAQRLYADAYNEAVRSNNQEFVALAATLLGGLGFVQGRMAEARGYLETGLQVANELDVSEHRALALFYLAWMETLSQHNTGRSALIDQLTPMVKPLGAPDFYLREQVARVARTVTVVRGANEAERYRRAALEVIHSLR